ncbi:ABC transporter substrate-binding protein [Thalassotalea sp. PLHSN55]|uniref:ABC transporter substrate-binding protein n=1 Tax=Thalassotalea sp. PLHSN55 TaxID=3435888 RepID=UPI003F86EDC4
MKLNQVLSSTLLFFLLHVPWLSYASNIKVVFLNPGHPYQNTTGHFWQNVSQFMEAAAQDLSIDLVTLYACRDHILMQSLVNSIAQQNPDYVILVNEKGKALSLVKSLSKLNLKTFMLLNGLSKGEIANLSTNEKSLNIGSVKPNNYSAGKNLLADLVKLHDSQPLMQTKLQPKNILALQGDYSTPAALERQQGFNDFARQNKKLSVVDSTVANWDKEEAYTKVKGILQRERIDIIWAANDPMALGAKKAVVELKPKQPVIIGGFNWDVKNSQYPIDISYGGHVSLGAYALVMIRDIADNKLMPNKNHQVIDIFESSKSKSQLTFSDNLLNNNFEQYEFDRFSLSHKAPLTFSIENLIKSLKKTGYSSE